MAGVGTDRRSDKRTWLVQGPIRGATRGYSWCGDQLEERQEDIPGAGMYHGPLLPRGGPAKHHQRCGDQSEERQEDIPGAGTNRRRDKRIFLVRGCCTMVPRPPAEAPLSTTKGSSLSESSACSSSPCVSAISFSTALTMLAPWK
eukprot:216223-Prorocentrum_minimum.AAC.1